MTTAWLCGNHEPCPACALRRELQDTAPIIRDPVPCNVCHGMGYLILSDADIVRRTIEEARRLYWPAFYARTGCSEDPRPPPEPAIQATPAVQLRIVYQWPKVPNA